MPDIAEVMLGIFPYGAIWPGPVLQGRDEGVTAWVSLAVEHRSLGDLS